MSALNKYKELLHVAGVSDQDLRDLIQKADTEGYPLTGRTLRIPAYIGEVYGVRMVFDSKVTEVCIDCEIPTIKRVKL